MSLPKTEKVIDPAARADAVLSHCLSKQMQNFAAREFDALDQAHNHPQVGQHRRLDQTRLAEHHAFQLQLDRRCAIAGRVWQRFLWGRIGRTPTAAVEPLLLAPANNRAIISGTTLTGTLPAMVLTAAERTTQIPPTGIAGMRQKANTAVYAVNNTAAKLGMRLQNRVQRRLILLNKRFGAVVLVPIRAKREKFLDGYGKKARFSVMMLIEVTPSSYLLDANASRGRTRFFMRIGNNSRSPPTLTDRLSPSAHTAPPDNPTRPHYESYSDLQITTWK